LYFHCKEQSRNNADRFLQPTVCMAVLGCADPLVDVIGPTRFRAWPSGGPDFCFRCHETAWLIPF
jgi:hypothetical protein